MEGLKGGTGGKGIARGIGFVVMGEVDIGEDSFRVKLSCKRIRERGLVALAGINEAMCSKDAVCGESTGDEKRERVWTMGEERIKVIEDTDSDTGIVSDLEEGDGEIEIITESTKIGEGRVDEEGSGEEMKGREAGMTGEDCGRDTTGSSAWP